LTEQLSVTIFFQGLKLYSHSDISGREDTMLEITKSATDKIAEYLKNREVTPIRIFLNSGG
jgi:hypothetical protein